MQEIFTQDIEVPEIVKKKADDAFSKIRQENAERMDRTAKTCEIQTYKKKRFSLKRPAAAAACICLLAASSLTALAAAYHYWSRGMQGNLQATPEQQNELVENGTTMLFESHESYESMAITSGGITVKPVETIVDAHFAHLSFSVEGYDLGETDEPCFEFINVYTGEDPDAEEGWVNMSGTFYDGIVCGNDGAPIYDDGTPLEFREDGSFVTHYTDENGALEFVMTLYAPETGESLLGKTIHVGFENLGTVYKAEYTNVLEGAWNFDIPLSGNDASHTYTPNALLGDSGATVKTAELSPISILLYYDFQGSTYEEPAIDANGNETTTTLDTEPPAFCGVRLKDGSMLKYIANGGSMGYTDEAKTEYCSRFAFDRVIDTEEVEALLFQKSSPDGDAQLTEDNLYVVPLE